MSFQQFIGLMPAPPSQLTLPSAHFCSVPEAEVANIILLGTSHLILTLQQASLSSELTPSRFWNI